MTFGILKTEIRGKVMRGEILRRGENFMWKFFGENCEKIEKLKIFLEN